MLMPENTRDWILYIAFCIYAIFIIAGNVFSQNIPVTRDLDVTGSVVSDRQLLTPGAIGGNTVSASDTISGATGLFSESVIIGPTTTVAVNGLTVVGDIYSGGTISSNSNLKYKDNIIRNQTIPWLLDQFTWKPGNGIRDENSLIVRSGIDADNPNTPRKYLAKSVTGEWKLDHGSSIGALIRENEELKTILIDLQKRVAVLEGK
jgi:hypothetical protein